MDRAGQRARTASRYAGPVVDRKDFGSWLQGPRERTSAGEQYRGRDLGLPQHGPGSVAGFGIRFVGVLIDWGIASVIARGLFGVPLPFSQPPASGGQGFVVLAVFGVMHLLLVGTVGLTIGHRVVGLQVRSLGGTGRVLPLQALARTLLLCMFIPAVVWDRDGRGLHDKVPGTVIVRTR
ncbi:RDD family protein [Terrabacter ginsenosidimutans]|uniref:RDD family protein n=1 Tax=Terrabacter ginsenosidimutans TaxID=490575 RepID=A0ABP7DBV8_9MICO